MATAVTVLGLILFMGALIAILVQWLNQTMDRLERGLTPVALNAHIVLLGWSSRTPGVLEEILASQGRIERFLRSRGARRKVCFCHVAKDCGTERSWAREFWAGDNNPHGP